MCGRYTLRLTSEQLQAIFNFLREVEEWQPRYNIAPSQKNPVIRMVDGKRHATSLRWGLIPPWAQDDKLGFKMINARSEEIAKSYSGPLEKRRCLVLTDGWYEWRDKQPFHFRFPNNVPFAFAGIWERWNNIETYCIFTTSSVGTASEYHERMPVIIPPEAYDVWLDPEIDGRELVEPLLKPWTGPLDAIPANPLVGNVRNETPAVLERSQRTLF